MNKNYLYVIIAFIISSCGLFDSDGYDLPDEKVYVALQAFDQVGIVDVKNSDINYIDIDYSIISCSQYILENDCLSVEGCEWMSVGGMDHCMDSADECMSLNINECILELGCEWMSMGLMSHCMEAGGMMDMGNHTPHFIAIDEVNGFWFTSTINSGYIGKYDLATNQLIDNIWIGDSPALLTLNEENEKIYVSRMMPMAGMMTGATSSIIEEIDYSGQNLVSNNQFEIGSPAPHGLSISSDGNYIFTVSNTADWLYKISTLTNTIEGVSLDPSIGNAPSVEAQRLKPIQCIYVNENLLLVSCSAGSWFNPSTGISEDIPGQVQLWDTVSMSMVDSIQFSIYSAPWHIVSNKNDNLFYVTLAGDPLYSGSSGIACISYYNNNLELIWKNQSESFSILHGIDLSDDGSVIYANGRGDDHLHIFDVVNGSLIKSIYLGAHAMSAGIKSIKK